MRRISIILILVLITSSSCRKFVWDNPNDTSITSNRIGAIDVDGNKYKTIVIGSQEWMAENLKTTKFNNGDQIANIIQRAEWAETKKPAFCNYLNDAGRGQLYGNLYNFNAVIDSRKLCPVGWRVPTLNDFVELENYLGEVEAGKLMKASTGWDFWSDPLQGNGNNESGFNGLPGGGRGGGLIEDFGGGGSVGNWWTSTEVSSSAAIGMMLIRENYRMDLILYGKVNGLSVRCIKN